MARPGGPAHHRDHPHARLLHPGSLRRQRTPSLRLHRRTLRDRASGAHRVRTRSRVRRTRTELVLRADQGRSGPHPRRDRRTSGEPHAFPRRGIPQPRGRVVRRESALPTSISRLRPRLPAHVGCQRRVPVGTRLPLPAHPATTPRRGQEVADTRLVPTPLPRSRTHPRGAYPHPMDLLRTYRTSGADLPFGNPSPARRGHGGLLLAHHGLGPRVAWRIAPVGVNRGPRGPGHARAGHSPPTLPSRSPRTTAPRPTRTASARARAGRSTAITVPCTSDSTAAPSTPRSRIPCSGRCAGGAGPASSTPSPASTSTGTRGCWAKPGGRAVVDGEEWEFTDAQVYGEKNWGKGGSRLVVVGPGPGLRRRRRRASRSPAARCTPASLRTEVTGLVMRLPDGTGYASATSVASPVEAHVSDTEWHLARSRARLGDRGGRPPRRCGRPTCCPLSHCRTSTATPRELIEHLGSLRPSVRRRARGVAGTSSLAGLVNGGLERAEAELRCRRAPKGQWAHLRADAAGPVRSGRDHSEPDPRPGERQGLHTGAESNSEQWPYESLGVVVWTKTSSVRCPPRLRRGGRTQAPRRHPRQEP